MINDNIILLKGLQYIYDSPFLENLRRVLIKYPNVELNDVFSQGQILSKLWLIKELSNLNLSLGTIFVLGGWYGSLPALMFDDEVLIFDNIRSFDIDPNCADIADTFNRTWVMDNWRFKASTADMHELNYYATTYITYRANGTSCEMTDIPTTLINTSCEHIEKFEEWCEKIPQNNIVILQSNNYYEGLGHINCVDTLYDFKKQIKVSNILFEGTLKLEKYNRFMVIGRK
jgi:hypothetical protein